MAPGLGIEPRLTESKSVVLPLHNPGTIKQDVFLRVELKVQCIKFAVNILKLVPLLGVEPRTLFLLREATLPICPQGHYVGGNGEIRTHGPFRVASFQD